MTMTMMEMGMVMVMNWYHGEIEEDLGKVDERER